MHRIQGACPPPSIQEGFVSFSPPRRVPQGNLIVSGSNDCKIKVWDADLGVCLRTLTGHDYLVRALSFDPCSGRLVSGSYDRTVKVWDLYSGKMMREFRGCHVSHIFDVKFDHCRIVRCVFYPC